jgi:hypothetical protein
MKPLGNIIVALIAPTSYDQGASKNLQRISGIAPRKFISFSPTFEQILAHSKEITVL